jgi:hypothetical protein
MDPAALKPVVGIALVSIAVLMLLSPRLIVSKTVEPVASPVVGVIGGLLGGLAALPGPLVFIYLIALGIERDRFVQYSSMFLAVAASLMAITLGGGDCSAGAMSWCPRRRRCRSSSACGPALSCASSFRLACFASSSWAWWL